MKLLSKPPGSPNMIYEVSTLTSVLCTNFFKEKNEKHNASRKGMSQHICNTLPRYMNVKRGWGDVGCREILYSRPHDDE
jgi:hypothetical protein